MNRKKLHLSIIALSIASYLFVISGCSEKPKQSAFKIGIIVCPTLASQLDIIKSASQAACSASGQGDVFIRALKSDNDTDFRQAIDKLIKEKESAKSIVGFVIGANCSTDLKPAIRKAVITGHPVILFNCDFPESKRDAYIGMDEISAGKMLGQEIANNAGQSTRVIVMITGDESILMYKQRASAIRKQIDMSANVNIIKTIINKNTQQAARELSDFLNHTPNIYAIVSTGDWIFKTPYENILSKYNGKIYAIANTKQAIDALKAGRVTALVVSDLYSEAYIATHLCLMRLQNQIVENPKPIKPVLVTQDNIKEFLKKWGKTMLVKPETSNSEKQDTR